MNSCQLQYHSVEIRSPSKINTILHSKVMTTGFLFPIAFNRRALLLTHIWLFNFGLKGTERMMRLELAFVCHFINGETVLTESKQIYVYALLFVCHWLNRVRTVGAYILVTRNWYWMFAPFYSPRTHPIKPNIIMSSLSVHRLMINLMVAWKTPAKSMSHLRSRHIRQNMPNHHGRLHPPFKCSNRYQRKSKSKLCKNYLIDFGTANSQPPQRSIHTGNTSTDTSGYVDADRATVSRLTAMLIKYTSYSSKNVFNHWCAKNMGWWWQWHIPYRVPGAYMWCVYSGLAPGYTLAN